MSKTPIEKYNRKTVFCKLLEYDHFADKDSYIELTEWANGEGFDVEVASKLSTRFQLTWGEFELIRKLVKQLDKYDS